MQPEDFPRAFAQAFAAQSGADVAALLAEDGHGLTLSGQWVEGKGEAEAAWTAEFAGLLARARLVTGRMGVKMLGPGAAVVNQRYVVTGALQSEGVDLPRFAAILTATIIARPEGWTAVAMSFSPISE
jgi:uncharacterized protein (TIGR02246 family)